MTQKQNTEYTAEKITVLKEKHNISVTVIDLRCLVPLDLQSIKREVKKSGIIFTVEELSLIHI